MKKLKTILFVFVCLGLALALFQFLFFTTFISLNKENFRKNSFKNSGTKTINLPIPKTNLYKNVNGIEWKDNNKEIVIAGNYYEVIKITGTNGAWLLTLVPDTEEGGLFKKYFSLAKKQQRSLNDLANQFLQLVYLNNAKIPQISAPVKTTSVSFNHIVFCDSTYVSKNIKPPCAYLIQVS